MRKHTGLALLCSSSVDSTSTPHTPHHSLPAVIAARMHSLLIRSHLVLLSIIFTPPIVTSTQSPTAFLRSTSPSLPPTLESTHLPSNAPSRVPSFIPSVPPTNEPSTNSDLIVVSPLFNISQGPSFYTNSSRVSSVDSFRSATSGQLQFAWGCILASLLSAATVLVCFFCWRRRYFSQNIATSRAIGDSAIALDSTKAAVLPVHFKHDGCGDGDKIGFMFTSYKIEMSRPGDLIII